MPALPSLEPLSHLFHEASANPSVRGGLEPDTAAGGHADRLKKDLRGRDFDAQARMLAPAPDGASGAEAHFQELLKMHGRARRLRDEARKDRQRYFTLARQGLGKKTEELEAAAGEVMVGAETLEGQLARAIIEVGDGKGGVKPGVVPAYVLQKIDQFRGRLLDLDLDSDYAKARAKPDTSVGGGIEYVGGATAVGLASGAYGAVTSVPLVGDVIDAAVGDDVRKGLVDAGSVMSDRETATMAHDRGKLIGQVASGIATANVSDGAGTVAKVWQGLEYADAGVDAASAVAGRDLVTGQELTGGQRVANGVGALGTLAKGAAAVDSTTAMTKDAAKMGLDVAPSTVSQVASGLKHGKTAVNVADQATTAATGYSPIEEKGGKAASERLLNAAGAIGSAVSTVAGDTAAGRRGTEIGRPTKAQQIGSGLEKAKSFGEAADAAGAVLTGQSVLKPSTTPASDASRIKAGGKIAKLAVKEKQTHDKMKEKQDRHAREQAAAQGVVK